MKDLFEMVQLPVLVVEDSDLDFDTILEATKRADIQNRIVHATDAEAAWNLLPPEGPAEPFAFILLDQNLPGMMGSEFLRELRSTKAYRSIPVVLYTTSDNPRDRAACYEAGANAYHVKSVRFDECLLLLGELFDYWLRRVSLPDPYNGRGPHPKVG